MTQDFTTLICLFHHKDQAHAALEDILKAGVPEANITLVGDPGSQITASPDTLQELNVPAKDLQHLLEGLQDGGVILTVSAISSLADKVDAIFKAHRADKIDEAVVADDMSGVNTLADAGDQALPKGQTLRGDENTFDDEALLEDETLLLVPSPDGKEVLVYRMAPKADSNEDDENVKDIDPREMGLDARMKPRPNDTDL